MRSDVARPGRAGALARVRALPPVLSAVADATVDRAEVGAERPRLRPLALARDRPPEKRKTPTWLRRGSGSLTKEIAMQNLAPGGTGRNVSCRLDTKNVLLQCLPVPLDRLANTVAERGIRRVDTRTALNVALRAGEVRLGHTDRGVLVVAQEGAP